MKILGVDYGRSKIGIAMGDTVTGLVEPCAVLKKSGFNLLPKLLWENEIEKIVIGITGGKIDEEIRVFGKGLEEKTKIPVEFFDETLTTQDAQKLLQAIKRKRKYRKKMEDAIASAVMLQYFIEGGKENV